MQFILTNLLNTINGNDFNTSTLKIRLQQIQNVAYTNISILVQLPVLPIKEQRTLTGFAISQLYLAQIQYQRPLNPWPKPLQNRGHSINTILQNISNAPLIKKRLNKLKIGFIEQFLNFKLDDNLSWKEFHHHTLTIPTGREPKWYQEIIQHIRETENPSREFEDTNPLTYQPVSEQTK